MSKGGAWRNEAAAELAARHLPHAVDEGPVLVMADPLPHVADVLEAASLEVETWHRRAFDGRPASPWPPPGPFAAVALRLPRAKDELEMAVHAATASLRPGGRLAVYGATDEGIKSAPRRIEPLLGDVRTAGVGNRCRVLVAERPEHVPGLRADLAAWRETFDPPVPGLDGSWVSYPGVFAHGRLDAGTALLLDHLPTVATGARVLDFGCGSGIVAAVMRTRDPGARVHLLDVDAVALAAAEENVPGAPRILGDGLAAAGELRFDLVVTNPPYHTGKAHTLDVVEALVRDAPGHLRAGGRLVAVVQKRLPLGDLLEARFRSVRSVADDRLYRVWEAKEPG